MSTSTVYAVAVTTLPTWAVYALGFGSPTLTAIIALIGQRLSRQGQKELEKRSRREEILRNLRWAAELGVSDDLGKARLGIQEFKRFMTRTCSAQAKKDSSMQRCAPPSRARIERSFKQVAM